MHIVIYMYVLVIAQPECNMPYIALEQYNAWGPQAPRATRAPAPNDVKLVWLVI